MPEDYDIGSDTVRLELYEMRMSGNAGLARNKIVTDRKPNWNFGAGQTDLTPHQRYAFGTVGEYAGSLILNLCWRPYVGFPNMPDVGGCIEVRSVRDPEDRLNVKPSDPIGVPFMLLLYRPPNIFHARGWQWSDWMRANCFQYPAGDRCWVCDNHRLLPMIELRRWIHARPIGTIAVGNRNAGAVQR